MTYLAQWRDRTPKGNAGRFHEKTGLTLDDLGALLKGTLDSGKVLWLYVQQENVEFRGSSYRAPK